MTDQGGRFNHYYEAGSGVTLLMLHGTGGNEHDLVELGTAVAPGAAILSPRGQVLENGMPRFFRRLAEGVFDLDDLHARTRELAAWIRVFAVEQRITDQPIVAIGFSNGANMAGSLLLSEPGLLAGAILLRPMVPFVPDRLPSLAGVKVLIGAGTHDQLITVAETERLNDLLVACNAEVELYWQPGGHGLAAAEITQMREWMSRQNW